MSACVCGCVSVCVKYHDISHTILGRRRRVVFPTQSIPLYESEKGEAIECQCAREILAKAAAPRQKEGEKKNPIPLFLPPLI